MVAVVMSTWNPPGGERGRYAVETVKALVGNLYCKDACIFRLIIADDGSDDNGFIYECAEIAYSAWGVRTVATVANRHGIGGSLNKALEQVGIAEHWLYCTDDWVLTKPLDIAPALTLMREFEYDYVRLNPMHPNLACKTKFAERVGWWLEIDQTQGGYAFATRPFLATKKFYTHVGPFAENLDAYKTETDYAIRVSKERGLRLAGLVDLHGGWKHVGVQGVGKIDPVVRAAALA